jgi:inhibitor of KinA sporulation pathway (predicted exonuclease)
MFPEYSDFKKNPWNMVKLTYRQHIIAHILLYKTFRTECQALSIIFTSKQHHINDKINTKSIETAKKELSKLRKGKFTRGYDTNGRPLVSDSTRKLLSDQKKQLYSNLENRKKQSVACKGTSNRKSPKYSIAANTRSETHKMNLKNSIKQHYANLSENEKKRINSGIYVTPIGNFTSTKFADYCKNADKPITSHQCKFKTSLFDATFIGITPRELGFFFIPKKSPELKQYCDDLNQVRQPSPNHPLASKLNDYLSREKLLP